MKRRIFAKEHDLFRKSFYNYLKDKVIPNYQDWEDARLVPREAWLAAGREGFLCPAVGEEYGGPGGDFLYSAIITEEISKAGLQGLFWWLHSDIVAPYIEKFASADLKQKWLPRCVTGETILAVAMTEPEAGSDLARLSTSAVREGDNYVVNGSKMFISNGQLADLFVVAVRTAETKRPSDGVSLLLIESDRKGFKRGRALEKIGLHAQDTSEIFFDNVKVPVENLLGNEGEGFKYLMQKLQQERLLVAISAVGAATGAFALTVDYVKKRRAFGQTIGQFQNTRFVMAGLATEIQVAQSFIDDLIPRHMAGDDVTTEVGMAKLFASEMQFKVADNCLQFFGGYGYMKEFPISRHFVDARVQRIYGGANEIMKELIARKLRM
ncbi:MAG: acyl-CoA dehydrogenase family protein [Deltaproteobacteria bacterium]|nr:acyl-CoA dehydrogenase family protein [Deltaproteobacteria bacterium]